ncbi:MAG: hypothetical protein R6U19_07315 [Bacteroidales bacterium]
MKGKFIVIALLLLGLGYVVYLMIQHETRIREQQVVTEVLEDETAPLLEKKPAQQLRQIAAEVDYFFRARGDYMEKLSYGYKNEDPHWSPVMVKGVNMGVALPGKFPSEFAMTREQYMDWLIKIGEMNANAVRTYTILPPEFYEAFAQYNFRHQDNPIYLFQGAWATIPEGHDYRKESYTRAFKQEIMDVIDVLNGNAVLDPVKGKASGIYATDVSSYVAGLILGREWEPNAVFKTNQKHEGSHYYGDFISMPKGSPMEAWLAEIMDFTVLYKTQKYKKQYPLSFVNWLPLDPMYHNTEFIENEKVREFDNDLEVVYFKNFHSHKSFRPGIYASYHAYPYYPDFIYLKQEYANAKNKSGEPDNYIGYLEDLKSNYQGMPLIIAEYGIPSSRGSSHVTPFGFDQGGHSEARQAEIATMLTRDIFHSGCAGGLYFEWADEWFKHNWLIMDFELPFHDRKYWHNMENPEQNFGILAFESRERTIDGSFDDWPQKFRNNKKQKSSFHADPSWFYLAWRLNELDFDHHNLYIAVDTYGKDKGSHRLPFSSKRYKRGFEFLLEFYGTDSAAILVDEPYSVFTDIYNDSVPGYASKPNEKANFVPQHMLTNRGRESLTGESFDSVMVNRGKLQHGKSNVAETSNADWYWDDESGKMEIRLTWHLLNVSNPAKKYVLDNQPGTGEMEYTQTNGFQIIAFVTDKENNIIRRYPSNNYEHYLWEGWEEPTWSRRLKPLYDSLKGYFRIAERQVDLSREITFPDEAKLFVCPYYQNKEGAVSFSFLGSAHTQVALALPVLGKYRVNAGFGVIPQVIDDPAGQYQIDEAGRRKRLSGSVLQEIRSQGHNLALQAVEGSDIEDDFYDMKEMINAPIRHIIGDVELSGPVEEEAELLRRNKSGTQSFSGINGHNLYASQISLSSLDSILKENQKQWLVLNYHYLAGEKIPEQGDSLFIKQKIFERQLRLARNHNYWLASEWDVFRYLKQRKHSSIKVSWQQDRLFVSLESPLDPEIYDHPLSIRFETYAPYVEVTSEAGQYTLTNRDGTVYFEMVPGTEIILKQIW